MWTLKEVVRIEQNFGFWSALVTLTQAGVEESVFLNFNQEQPTLEQAALAGMREAKRRNLEAAIVVEPENWSRTREEFFAKFTNAEIAAIYRAAQANDDLFAYLKKAEINPTVNLRYEETMAGVQLLEAAGLLAPGRANQILEL